VVFDDIERALMAGHIEGRHMRIPDEQRVLYLKRYIARSVPSPIVMVAISSLASMTGGPSSVFVRTGLPI